MIHPKLWTLIVIVLCIYFLNVTEGKFFFQAKTSFLGRLYKKVTVQPNYCLTNICACGSANSKSHPSAGVQLEQNEYPWLALIYDPHDLTVTYPGTLISDKYVISSASNFHGKSPFQMKVKLGYHFNCQYEKTSITMSVVDILLHPQYVHSAEQVGNDIALLKLSNAVHFNREISPICLPSSSWSSKGVDSHDHVGYLATWNLPPKTAFDMPSINCTPRRYKLPITSGFHCSDSVAAESESCIGVYGAVKSILCERDSGSGVFLRKSNHYELLGVLSHRQNCGELNLSSPLVIKDQIQNGTIVMEGNSSTTVTVEDLKMKKNLRSKGRQLHSLNMNTNMKQSDPILAMTGQGDHIVEPLPVLTRIDHHLDWIVEHTRDSCFCKPRFYFSLNFNAIF